MNCHSNDLLCAEYIDNALMKGAIIRYIKVAV